jgi:hypothetical protein
MFQIPKVQLFKFQSYILKFSHFLQMCNASNFQCATFYILKVHFEVLTFLANVQCFKFPKCATWKCQNLYVGVMPLDGIKAHYHNRTNTCETTCLLIIPSSLGVTLQIFGSLSIIVHTTMLLGGAFQDRLDVGDQQGVQLEILM